MKNFCAVTGPDFQGVEASLGKALGGAIAQKTAAS
jgi:hypothetical protein